MTDEWIARGAAAGAAGRGTDAEVTTALSGHSRACIHSNTHCVAIANLEPELVSMRGDVRAIERIEKKHRSSSRVQLLIKKRLDKSRKGARNTEITAVSARRPATFFAKQAIIVPRAETKASRRRIRRTQTQEKKNVFLVCDVVENFEDVVALVVFCATEQASIGFLGDTCMKESGTSTHVSDARVPLFECRDGVEINGKTHTSFFLRKLHLQDGQQLFLVASEDAGAAHAAWALGLDRATYEKIQKSSASMLGLSLVHT